MNDLPGTGVLQPPPETCLPKRKRGKRGPKPGHGGRPKCRLQPALIAERLVAEGFTMSKIAYLMGISERTLRTWKVQDKKLSAGVKRGRAEMIDRVEDSLVQRALGMTIPETKVSVINGEIVLTTIKKHLPPDTLACIFYLKNRAPERWGDHQSIRVQQTIAGVPEGILDRWRAAARAKNFSPAVPAQVVDVETRPALPPARQ